MDHSSQQFRTMRDMNPLKYILCDDINPVKHINAIKSCIEADEAGYLIEILNNNYKAKIYSLIRCFTFIPSIRCIKYLIAEGTPLNETFENNPFQCTPQEYLDRYFPAPAFETSAFETSAFGSQTFGSQTFGSPTIMNGIRHNYATHDVIYDAINRGKLIMKTNTYKKSRQLI